MIEISTVALFSVLGCGLCYAGSDFTRKLAGQFCAPTLLTAIIFTTIIPIYLTLFFLSDNFHFSNGYIVPGTLNALSNLIANILFVRSVTLSPLSKTIPLLSLTPVFTAIIGYFFLGEFLSLFQWLGVSFVVLGILWLYTPDKKAFNLFAIWQNFIAEKGAKYMCYVAFFWTLAPVFDRIALRHTNVATHALIHFTIVASLLWLWLFIRGRLKKSEMPDRKHWKTIGILALLYAGALGLQMLSLTMIYVGIVESVKRVIGQISSIIFGRIAFNEPLTKGKILGVLTMCAGVPLIILG